VNIYFSNDNNSKRILAKYKKGLLYKVVKGIYVKKPKYIYTYIEDILEKLKIKGVIFYKSAIEYPKNIQNSELFIVSETINKKLFLGENKDLIVYILKKPNTEFIRTFALQKTYKENIFIPNEHYALLINFSTSSVFQKRANKDFACVKIVDNCLKNFKNIELIKLELQKINNSALILKMEKEYYELENYITKYIQENYKNYDQNRVKLFKVLKEYLLLNSIQRYPKINKNILFYEAYFSNYIEGTEFEVEEAQRIIFNPKHRYERHKDGHDIISTYNIVKEIYNEPLHYNSSKEFKEALKSIHKKMLIHRASEIIVGNFKKTINVSGNLKFVIPSLVNNTLDEGFKIYKELLDPFHKAIFIHMLIAEVHPFDDGNGRISRIFFNNELSKAGINHIIIPTVFRDDYITALKGFSHQGNPNPIISAFIKAYKITNSIDWSKPLNDINIFIRENSGFEKDVNSIWGISPQIVSKNTGDFSQRVPRYKRVD